MVTQRSPSRNISRMLMNTTNTVVNNNININGDAEKLKNAKNNILL